MRIYKASISSLLLASAIAAWPIALFAQTAAPASSTAATVPTKPWTQAHTPDGQPDWQGFWRANPGGDTYDISGMAPRPDSDLQGDGKKRAPIRRIVDPPDGNIPYQPWAAAKAANTASHVDNPTKPEYIDTQAHCLLEGPVRVFIHSGFQILQSPGYIIFFAEQNEESRIIPLDGPPHLAQDVKLWQGDSRGHWEGDTLVIDVTNVKGKSRLDMKGDFYGPATHFVERFTRVDANTINYEATVTDPAVYTQPWKVTARFTPNHKGDANYELWEDSCHEGEQSADRMVIPPDVAKTLGVKP
jgi:hypothetical protein